VPELLTVREVAGLLKVSRAQAYAIARKVGIIRLGRSVRVEPDALAAYLRRCRQPGDSIESIDVARL
jgi:excisionase family DNA binding protein